MCSKSEVFSEKEIPDMSGHVAIVTGGNSGIGFETAYQLAARHARVYIASRSEERVNTAIQQMIDRSGEKLDLHFLQIDLQDIKSVKRAADDFRRRETQLDILINNAGVMTVPYKLTDDGFETQWQVNYLAPHTFTLCLLPMLIATAAKFNDKERVRVINVSSNAAMFGPKEIKHDDVNLTNENGNFALWKRYGHSKQASIRDAKEFNTRYQSQGITAFSLHPGIVKSNLQSHDSTALGAVVRFSMRFTPTDTPLKGALTSLYCATSPMAPKDAAGAFLMPVAKVGNEAKSWLADDAGNSRLWELGNAQMRQCGVEV